MRVAGEVAVAVERAEEEPEHDLAEAIARRLGESLHLLEADPVDPLGDEHALAREVGDDARHERERVPPEAARERSLGLRLVLVVELLREALAHLGADRLRVEARRYP